MQLRKMMLMLTALSAMGGFMAGCGDDGGDGPATCTSNDDCNTESEICHPTAGVCVQTCEAATDCPDTAKTCAPLGGTGPNAATRICQCSTDQLCNGDSETADLVCSDLDNVCVTKCASDGECGEGRVCNETSGQCEEDDTTGGTCSGEGRSTCTYGQVCTNSTCSALPTPACENYTNFQNKADLGTTGPIIFKAEVVGAAIDNNFCGSGSTPKRVRVRLSAYSNTAFPQTSAELNGLFYVITNGTRSNASISSSPGNYTVTGTNRDRADIIVNFCRESTSTTTSTGYYFSGGNFLCFQANYQ